MTGQTTRQRARDGGMPGQAMSVSVIIVTSRRAAYVRRCLDALRDQQQPPDQIIVVDASEDDATRNVVRESPAVLYVHFPGGAGHMTTARNEGLMHARGDIIAFLDDDTRPHPDWCRNLHESFADEQVAAVAGRTLNAEPGEERTGVEEIGRLYPDGRLTGNFAAKPQGLVAIDHGIGANMSFRRQSLATLGGFRDNYPGTAMREDTDVFLRLRAMKMRLIFDPEVCVDHLPAPHVKGQRFDLRYAYFSERNHLQLLSVNFGLSASITRRYAFAAIRSLRSSDADRRPMSRFARSSVRLAGVSAGLGVSLRLGAWRALPPQRLDATGRRIRSHLSTALR